MATTTYRQPKTVPNANAYGATKAADLDMCVANIDRSNQTEKMKTSGIKIRGTGAATKGVMARGPMA
jgi:hypothetical protein